MTLLCCGIEALFWFTGVIGVLLIVLGDAGAEVADPHVGFTGPVRFFHGRCRLFVKDVGGMGHGFLKVLDVDPWL